MDTLKYSFASPLCQQFSLPSTVIYYLTKNYASPKIFEKLQKTCKYFFFKKPIIIIFDTAKANFDQRLSNLNNYHLKYWVINFLNLKNHSTLPKCIYRCDLNFLELGNCNFKFEEISFLLNGGKVNSIILKNVNIKYEDETPVTLDAIIKQCPKLTHINYSNLCEKFSNETFQKLKKIKITQKMKRFELVISNIETKINANIFTEFIKNFMNQETMATFFFNCDLKDFNEFQSTVKFLLGSRCRWPTFR